MRSDRFGRWTALGFLLVLGLARCGSSGATNQTAPVAVTDVSSVAGKWGGLLSITGSRDREDYVEVTVDANGAYRASSARTIGVLDTKGTVTASGGRLVIKGDSAGQGTAPLSTRPPPAERHA